jgi:hypothetical protein
MIANGEVAVFEEGGGSLEFLAQGTTRFVFGSARKHPYDLVLGDYSVHSTDEALRRGEAEIRRIETELRGNGTLRG